jgi:hypothetical protein
MDLTVKNSFTGPGSDYDYIYEGQATIDGYQMSYLDNGNHKYTDPFWCHGTGSSLPKKTNGKENNFNLSPLYDKTCRANPRLYNCGLSFNLVDNTEVKDNADTITIPFASPRVGSLTITKTSR